jgi:hypothetical protein
MCENQTSFKDPGLQERIRESGSAPVNVQGRKGFIKFTHHSQNGKLIQTKEKTLIYLKYSINQKRKTA